MLFRAGSLGSHTDARVKHCTTRHQRLRLRSRRRFYPLPSHQSGLLSAARNKRDDMATFSGTALHLKLDNYVNTYVRSHARAVSGGYTHFSLSTTGQGTTQHLLENVSPDIHPSCFAVPNQLPPPSVERSAAIQEIVTLVTGMRGNRFTCLQKSIAATRVL